MTVITLDGSDAWIAVQEGIDLAWLKSAILSSDVVASDLDHTDSKSPAEKVVKEYLLKNPFEPRRAWWYISSVPGVLHDLITGSDDRKIRAFDRLRKQLKPENLKEIRGVFSEQQVSSMLYPSTTEFYRAISPIHKVYITRNLEEVAEAFASYLGFNEYVANVRNKELAIEDLVRLHCREFAHSYGVENPLFFRRYILKDDERINGPLDVLEFYKKKGHIDSVIGIKVASSKERIDEKVTVNIGRDYKALVNLLNS